MAINLTSFVEMEKKVREERKWRMKDGQKKRNAMKTNKRFFLLQEKTKHRQLDRCF